MYSSALLISGHHLSSAEILAGNDAVIYLVLVVPAIIDVLLSTVAF